MIMVTHSQVGSPSFALVANGLVKLHRLGKNGKDDSPEADSIRDELDAPLDALSQTEKAQAQWLSEDLYSVSEPSPPQAQKEMTPQVQRQLDEVLELQKSGNRDQALGLLRNLAEYLAPAVLSEWRGRIWQAAGYPDIAAFFYEHAFESDRANAAG